MLSSRRFARSEDEESFGAFCAAAASCCSALVGYLMATSKEHALRSYRRDLTSTFPSASAHWALQTPSVRRHLVRGPMPAIISLMLDLRCDVSSPPSLD